MARFIAKLRDFAYIPPGAIYRGDGDVEFSAGKIPEFVKERLAEFDDNGNQKFRKPGFTKNILNRPGRLG